MYSVAVHGLLISDGLVVLVLILFHWLLIAPCLFFILELFIRGTLWQLLSLYSNQTAGKCISYFQEVLTHFFWDLDFSYFTVLYGWQAMIDVVEQANCSLGQIHVLVGFSFVLFGVEHSILVGIDV